MIDNKTEDYTLSVEIPGPAEDRMVLRLLAQRAAAEEFAPVPGSRTTLNTNYDVTTDTTYGTITYHAYEEPSSEVQPDGEQAQDVPGSQEGS